MLSATNRLGLSALAYCIGTINLRRLGQTSLQHTVDDFVLNAAMAAQCVKEALPHLRKHEHAAVLLFSTVAVAQGFPSHTSVAMAKGAVEALTRTLAAELAPKVRVNCIAPSLVATDLAKSVLGTSPVTSDAFTRALPHRADQSQFFFRRWPKLWAIPIPFHAWGRPMT